MKMLTLIFFFLSASVFANGQLVTRDDCYRLSSSQNHYFCLNSLVGAAHFDELNYCYNSTGIDRAGQLAEFNCMARLNFKPTPVSALDCARYSSLPNKKFCLQHFVGRINFRALIRCYNNTPDDGSELNCLQRVSNSVR